MTYVLLVTKNWGYQVEMARGTDTTALMSLGGRLCELLGTSDWTYSVVQADE